MIILDATTKSLTVAMSGAAATTNPDFVAAWSDDTGTSFTEGSTDGALNGASQVTLVAAPAASTRRIIKTIYIENKDTAAVTITVTYNNNGTLRTIAKVTLQVADTWSTDGTTDSTGALKQTLGTINLATQVTGVLPVANGGTGVTASTGANSVVLRDASVNISANVVSEGYSNVAAAGTTTTLTVASVPNYVVTGSGGQTYQLPDATTLANGANYTFNNNQSSGTIVVKNNSSTTITTIQSGGFVDVSLLSNSTSAGTWDVHNFAPSNVSWSTNTLDYAGSITSATWNGTTVAYNRGGTGQSSAFTQYGVTYASSTTALATSAAGTTGQLLQANTSGAPTWVTPTYATTGKAIAMAMIFGF